MCHKTKPKQTKTNQKTDLHQGSGSFGYGLNILDYQSELDKKANSLLFDLLKSCE